MKYFERFPEIYKNIQKSEDENFVIVDCWRDGNCSVENYVHIVFDKKHRKVYYTGNMGTYVFGQNIQNPLEFFKKSVNLPYWDEKIEAYERPIKEENLDLDEVEKNFRELLSEYYEYDEMENAEDIEDDLKDLFKYDIQDSLYVRVFDKLYEFLSDHFHTFETEDVSWCLNNCTNYTERYIWCVELLHYIYLNYL